MEKIKFEKVSYWYPEGDKPALRDINLEINEGELVLVVGPSGCGKSTLLRMFNRLVPDYYGGKIQGRLTINGRDLRGFNKKEIVKKVGMVYQHPEKQIVMEDVEREIAFGLENLNTEMSKMKRNVAEVMSFLNLSDIKDKSTQAVSGGEKQRIAIASVIAMDPDIMLFDEPTSQLDPIAAEEVFNFIKRINRDTGKTIILVEQRLDRCFDMVDRIIFMEEGLVIAEGTPRDIPSNIYKNCFLPELANLFRAAGHSSLPINVKDARWIIRDLSFIEPKDQLTEIGKEIISVSKLSFGYEKGIKVLEDVSFSVNRGEILAVLGENGAGKSTLFKLIAGLNDGYSGRISIGDRDIKTLSQRDRITSIGYLSQNPNDYLGRNTVFEEIGYTLKNIDTYNEAKVEQMISKLGLEGLRERNPRDLSGGEKQRLAIACTIVSNPEILILDEPTRGLDALNKERLGDFLLELSKEGTTIIIITHDSDFAANYTNNVMMMFDGEVISKGSTRDVLYDAIYYSPQIAKMFKNKCKIVSFKAAKEALKVIK